MSTGASVAVGVIVGSALGIVVSLITDIPLAPEGGLLLGALGGWLLGREST
jgi:large-conductance mechanosensitive channel